MILEERNGIVYLNVIVSAKSSKNEVMGVYSDSLKVKVMAAPEKGKANAAAIEVLAEFFHIKRSQVQLFSGETSRNKVFTLDIPFVEAQKILVIPQSTTTYIDKCRLNGPLTLHPEQNNVITNSMFNSINIASPPLNSYKEKECFRQEDHKLFKAMNILCPCSNEIPLLVRGKGGREIRIYDDDIVFMNTKGEFESSVVDGVRLMKEQQETIKQLQKQVERLEKKLRKK